jgi:hypothetical protein
MNCLMSRPMVPKLLAGKFIYGTKHHSQLTGLR